MGTPTTAARSPRYGNMNDEQIITEALDEIDNLHEDVRLITHAMQQYSITTTDDQNTYSKVIMALAECIEIYVARLEVATDKILKACNGGVAA